MPKTRVILELGSGNDLHGSDYTKAALRAVQDALHHSSLSFIRSLQIDKTKLNVEVTIGVQRPQQVDLEKVKSSLPVGNVTVKAVKGGLDCADPESNDPAVIASAAIDRVPRAEWTITWSMRAGACRHRAAWPAERTQARHGELQPDPRRSAQHRAELRHW